MPAKRTTPMHKTSMAVPANTWKALRIAAIEDGEQVQAIVARLVEEYLVKRRKGGKGR